MLAQIGVVLILLWLLIFLLKGMSRPKNFPPGPRALPIIGSLHHIHGDFNRNLLSLSKKYGNVFSLKIGHVNAICVIGLDNFKEVMLDNSRLFAGRPNRLVQTILRGEAHGGIVLSQYGPKQVAHRKLFHAVLRNMGLGRKEMGHLVAEELPYFLGELQQLVDQRNTLVDPSLVFQYASLNVLAYFVFGNRYSYQDQKFKELLDNNFEIFKKVVKTNTAGFLLVSLIPKLHKIWLPKVAKEIQMCVRKLMEFIGNEVEYHKSTIDKNNPRDIIDYYLMEIASQTSNHFNEEELKNTILDLFQAGTETTSTTLKWAVLYMVNNPDVQEKVWEEINKVLAADKLPTYEDKMRMPYTEATILEIQRKSCMTPVGVLHATTDSVKLAGYSLPKGTMVIPSYQSFLYSPDHWENPNKFDPQNFLDSDGTVGTRPAFMPFGAGLRSCLGINIAKQELFMFFTSMLQRFKFEPPPGILKLDEDYIPGLTLQPKPYSVVIKNRN